jgi:hypothetical protein
VGFIGEVNLVLEQNATTQQIKDYASLRDIILSNDQIAMIHIPNMIVAFDCYLWMLNHFTLMGDCQRVCDGQWKK